MNMRLNKSGLPSIRFGSSPNLLATTGQGHFAPTLLFHPVYFHAAGRRRPSAQDHLTRSAYFHNHYMKTKAAITSLVALAQETCPAIFRYMVEAGPEGVTVGRIGEALDIAPAP